MQRTERGKTFELTAMCCLFLTGCVSDGGGDDAAAADS